MTRLDALSNDVQDRPQRVEGRPRSYFWTTPEVATLSLLWNEGKGIELLLTALPGRSQSAIEQKASDIGLAKSNEAPSLRPTANGKVDAEIKAAYSNGDRGAVQKLSASLGVPHWWISRRAGQLGLVKPRLREPDWTPPEIDILARSGREGVAVAHRALRVEGFDRSVASVASRLRTVKLTSDPEDAVSARSLATLMGVDEKTVVRWITTGGLVAARSGAGWRVTRKAIRTWVIAHPQLITLRSVEAVWFIELLAGS